MFLRDANSQKRKRRGLLPYPRPIPRQDNNYAGILHLLYIYVYVYTHDLTFAERSRATLTI